MTTVNLLLNSNFGESISTRSQFNQWRPESLGTGSSVTHDSANGWVRLRVEGLHEYTDVHYDRDHFCSYDYLVKNRATVEVDMVDLQSASTLQIQYWVEYQTPDGSGQYELGKIYFQVRAGGSEGLSDPLVYEVFANDNHTSDTSWRTATITIPASLKALSPDTLVIEAWGGLKPLWIYDASIPGPAGEQGWANIYINYVTLMSEVSDPVPSFTCAVDALVPPITVNFTDKTVWGSPYSTYLGATGTYLWNFGDGQTSTVQNPTHVYTIPGEYTVTLTVTRYFTPNIVRSYTYSTPIDATRTLPVARFYAARREVHTGDSVTFTNLSKGNPEPRSIWTINGQTYYTKHPTVTFTNEGIYNVKLELNTINDYAKEYGMAASAFTTGHWASYMTDGDPDTYWDVESEGYEDWRGYWVWENHIVTTKSLDSSEEPATHYSIRCHGTDTDLAPKDWEVWLEPTDGAPLELLDTITDVTWSQGEEKIFAFPAHTLPFRYAFRNIFSSTSNAVRISEFRIYNQSDEVLTDSVEKAGYITVMDEEYTKTSVSSLYQIYFDGVLATLSGAGQPLGARYLDLNITRTIDTGEGDSAEFSIIIPTDTVAGKLTVGTEVMILNETDIIFSGEMTEVSKELLSPPNVPIQKYKYRIKCRGDIQRLYSVVTNKDNLGTTYGTPAEIVKAILPEAWRGELLDMGESSSFNIVTGSVGENLNNYVENIKYSIRARRPRLVLKAVDVYQSAGHTYLCVVGNLDYIIFKDDVLISPTSKTAYTIYETSDYGIYTEIDILGTYSFAVGDILIAPLNPVIDFSPEFDDVTGRANFIANKDAFDVKSDDAQDIKKTLFIIKGKDADGNLISTTTPSCLVRTGALPEYCTLTSVRDEGIICSEETVDPLGVNCLYVKGHNFKLSENPHPSVTGEWWYLLPYPNMSEFPFKITDVIQITEPNGDKVSKLILDRYSIGVKKGWNVSSKDKIYVDNISLFESYPKIGGATACLVGEELVQVYGIGADELGNYIIVSDVTHPMYPNTGRTQSHVFTDGKVKLNPGIPHGTGVLVRPITLNGTNILDEDHPQDGSPIDLYGKRVETLNISTNTTMQALEQYATACLVNGSTPYKTGEITVTPYQLRDMTSSTFSRIKPGDMVSITHSDGTVDEVRVSNYSIDAMRMRVTLEYGEVRKDLMNAINKKVLANNSNV